MRGKAISGAPIINGTNQLPNPPIMIGMTIKKIMTKAWAVTITLQIWSSPINEPGCPSSNRIRTLKAVPTIADHTPKIKYKVPISLWLVENIQRKINKMADYRRQTVNLIMRKIFFFINKSFDVS